MRCIYLVVYSYSFQNIFFNVCCLLMIANFRLAVVIFFQSDTCHLQMSHALFIVFSLQDWVGFVNHHGNYSLIPALLTWLTAAQKWLLVWITRDNKCSRFHITYYFRCLFKTPTTKECVFQSLRSPHWAPCDSRMDSAMSDSD